MSFRLLSRFECQKSVRIIESHTRPSALPFWGLMEVDNRSNERAVLCSRAIFNYVNSKREMSRPTFSAAV